MRPLIVGVMALAAAALTPGAVHAQMTITPAAGQSPEQMAADQSACATQAAAQTGYHPSQPGATTQSTERQGGQRLAGAARGAAAGAIREQRTDADEREFEESWPAACGSVRTAVPRAATQPRRSRQRRRWRAPTTRPLRPA